MNFNTDHGLIVSETVYYARPYFDNQCEFKFNTKNAFYFDVIYRGTNIPLCTLILVLQTV
jgi:hypothetical protein